MAESKPVDVDYEGKATPLGAADPVEVPAIMGGTFAERAAASRGGKQVDGEGAEDKAVEPKKTARKSTRKKS